MRNYGFLDGGIICRPSYVKGLEAAAAKPAQASHSDSAGERQHRRAAAASRHPPTYGGVGVVPSKASSVMPSRPRRQRPNRLRVRVPLLSPPAKRLRTCGRRERDGQRTYIWVSTRCRCKMHHSFAYAVGRRFFSWTKQNGFGCRNGYLVGDSLSRQIEVEL